MTEDIRAFRIKAGLAVLLGLAAGNIMAVAVPPALAASAPTGSSATGLYEGRTVVNLYPDVIRRGYAADLQQVLIKVSGDDRLAGDPRLAAALDDAEAYATGVTYIDRRGGGVALHDEQGSRDRAHDMRVMFDPNKVAALLAQVGHRPWPNPRPVVTVYAALRDLHGHVGLISADGAGCSDQRDSLNDASDLRGLPVRLPEEAALAAAHVDYGKLAGRRWRPKTAGPALVGVIDWDGARPGWTSVWRLAEPKRASAAAWGGWSESYDAALRLGIGGAARVLSGRNISMR